MARLRFANKKESFSTEDGNALTQSLVFIEEALREIGLGAKSAMRTILLAEEMIPQLLDHAAQGSRLRVQVRRLLGEISISIHAEGERFDPFEESADTREAFGELEDEEAQRAIRAILLRSQGDKLKISHKNGVNHVRILAYQTNKQMLLRTFAALALGLACGILMKRVFPAALSDWLTGYLLNPAQTMFMNALAVVIGPGVFFSMVSCISQYKDLPELGRIGGKVAGMYLMTSLIAVMLSLGLFALLHPGIPGFALSLEEGIGAVSVDADMDASLLHTIVSIVPSNFARAFLESNTLQIIFLAVLCGAAVGMVGEYTPVLQSFFEACNSLLQTITTMISRLIPLVVFCAVAIMTAKLGRGALLAVLGFGGAVLLAILCMMAVYGLLVLLLGRLNPITFFKKNRAGMMESLTSSSSSAAMPTNMRICTDKLGISQKVCAFSIPLGATVNMDGTSIFLAVGGLFLARAYGVTVSDSAMVSLAVTIILLSLGCPGVPGSALVCMGVVLGDLGVPLEAIGLVMAIVPFIDMFATMSNTTGDVATALIVARSEELLDIEAYQK